MARHLFVVSGFSRSGKTTVADYIRTSRPNVYQPKFASKVKREVERALNLPFLGIDLYPEVKEKAIPLLLEAYEKASWVQENIWMPAVMNDLKEMLYKSGEDYTVIFDDVRRESEAKAILALYREFTFDTFDYISITSPTREKQLSSDPDKQEHWYWFDGVPVFRFIMNNGSLERLHRRVEDITL